MLDRETDELLTQVAHAVAQATTAEDKLYAFCITRFGGLRRKVALNSIMAGEVLRDINFVYRIRRRYRQRESDLLKQILLLGTTVGTVPGLSPQDLDAVVFVVLGGMHGLEQEMLLTNDSTLLEPAVRILSRALIHGLAT